MTEGRLLGFRERFYAMANRKLYICRKMCKITDSSIALCGADLVMYARAGRNRKRILLN